MDNNNLNLEFLVVSAQHHARVTPSSRGKNVRPRCSPHLNNESELKKKKIAEFNWRTINRWIGHFFVRYMLGG